jgi:hypothetical protein
MPGRLAILLPKTKKPVDRPNFIRRRAHASGGWAQHLDAERFFQLSGCVGATFIFFSLFSLEAGPAAGSKSPADATVGRFFCILQFSITAERLRTVGYW